MSSSRFNFRGRRALLAATAAIALPFAAVAGSAAASSNSSSVKLSEFKISASPKSAKAGKVTFTVKNSGSLEHEMVVIKTTQSAAKLPLSGGQASEKGSKGEVEVPAGKSKKLTLSLPKGHYALICNIGGHYMAGMHTDFTVK